MTPNEDLSAAELMDLAAKAAEDKHMPAAVAYWRLAAAKGNTDAFLNIGLHYARLCVAEGHEQTKARYLQSALSALVAIYLPEYGRPQASLYMGILAEHVAMLKLSTARTDEELLGVHNLFAKAGEYYTIAASMEDDQGGMYPQTALNATAALYEKGVGVTDTVNLEKAYALRLQAAEGGFWEAQVNVAVMKYLGQGTERSLPQAAEWLRKAIPSIAADNPLKQEAAKFLEKIEAEEGPGPARTDAGIVPPALAQLGTKTPTL